MEEMVPEADGEGGVKKKEPEGLFVDEKSGKADGIVTFSLDQELKIGELKQIVKLLAKFL